MKRLVYIFLALASYALSAFANESEYTYTVAGTPASLFDSEWDASFSANDMVLQEDGTYQLRKTGVNLVFGVPIMYRVVQNHTWNVSYPNSNAELKIDCSGEYDVTFIFNPSNNAVDAIADLKEAITIVPSIALAGEMNNWSSTDYFTVSEDNLTSSIQCHLDVGTYEFKVLIGGYWVGVVNSTTITRADNSAIVDTNGGNSLYLNVDVAGVYTFVWTFETNTLTVMYPEVGGTTNVLSCTQAAELCTSTTPTTETYTIRGYVTQITQEYSSNYNNITFWMADEVDGGQVLMAYRVQPTSTTDQAVKVGDYVEVVGSLQLYSTTPEVAQGGSYTILNASSAPAENQCGDNLYWEYNGGTLTITGDGAMYDYTRSSAPWNSYLENITAITLPSGITTIGNYAFSDMTNLSKISLPSSLLSIGKNAFYHCASLSSITIPANVDTIVPFAFAGCSALTSIRVNAKNTTYDSRNSCNAVIHTATNTLAVGCQNTVIPADVVKIGDAAFERATFSYIEIPNTVTEIAQYAFYGCEYLTTIDLPDNLTTLGYAAFRHCYALNEVVIPSTVTQIEGSTFSGCTSLTSIVVESGNTKYDSRNSCNAIIETATNTLIAGCQNTVIPNNVTSIGSQAFYQCSSLTSITIPNNVTSIGIQAFSSCSSLTSVTVEATTPPTLGTYVFSSSPTCYIPAGTLSAYQASDWAQYVGSFVEQGSTTTPASDFHNFEDASLNAEWQFIQSGQTNYWTIGTAAGSASTGSNALYITNNGSNYAYTVTSSSVSWAYIPVSLDTNDTISFYWKGTAESCCDYLAVYLMPIGSLPTAGSTTLPDGTITLTNKLNQQSEWQLYTATPAVSGNYNLCFMWQNDGSVGNTSIAVDNVSVGNNHASTENKCGDNLYWEYADGNLSIIGVGEMYNYDYWDNPAPWSVYVDELTSVSLSEGVTTVGSSTFYGLTNLSKVSLPNTITQIHSRAFEGCDTLTDIIIPSTVTTIGAFAFEGTSISSLHIPSSVTNIGMGAFMIPDLAWIIVESGNAVYESRNSNAVIASATNTLVVGCQNTVIPDGIVTIGNRSFCSNRIESIFLPSSVTIIDEFAFASCDLLTSVNIPDHVTSIGDYAFSDCAFSSITLPNGLTSIGQHAFDGCASLQSITIPASVAYIGIQTFSSCASLTSMVVNSDNTHYDSRDNCHAIIETATNTLISGCQSTIIPNTVTKLDWGAFYHCDALTQITIPSSVVSMDGSFIYCDNLETVTVLATTPPTIGTNTFTSRPICYIPAGTLAAYQASDWASQVGSFVEENVASTTITYELNGGVTNDYGWMTKNDMFQACMADCGVTELPSLDEIKALADPFTTICGKLTDVTRMLNAEKWDWLETYIMSVQNADASATALTEGTTSAGWRYALAAFFLESTRVVWPVSADFSQAGTVQAFMPAWQHGFTNPTAPTTSFVLNAPYKEGYTFGGWYTNATFSGSNITTVNASTTGTLYAKWIEGTAIPTTNAHICYGESYTWEVDGVTYTESGTYTYADEWGMAAAILNLTIAPAPIIEADSVVITENELPYNWRGVTIAEAGSYVTTEQSINGCDSVIHELYLIVEANATVYNAYICYGETYSWEVSGLTYSESGTYTYSDWATGETTAILNLTVSPAPVMDIDNVTINENELPYIWDGYTINAAGGYTYTEESVHGCDSVIHELYLTVESSSSGSTSVDYCDFESSNINAQWQFIQSGQTNYWTIGTGAGSASAGSNALYITNDGYNYSYTNNSVSVSWAYIPVELETSDTISFYWKGTAESSYDNMRVYLYPENSLPTAGSSTASNDAVQVTSTYLCGQSSWQYFTGTPGVAGRYNLCFMWKNDASSGSMPIAVDEIRISQMTVPALPENQCGENLYWAYNNGTLTIGGSGAMYDSHELLSYRQQSWFPDAVTAVSLPNGMTHIGATAFADCSNLTSITIPSTVTSIGAEAFAWSGLERITLPESVQDIAEMAFVKCGKMTNFVWRGTPSTLGNVYNHMFLGCNQLDTVIAPARMWECSSANADIHTYYGFPSHIRYVEVTSGELSSNAISYIASSYESLTTLDISAVSNASLPTQAFASWTALETLHLPVNLTDIPNEMVYGCTNLSNISIPNYVQEISNGAFSGCVKLHSIDFADGQNLLSIGQYAFYNCSTLVSVTVPEGVQTLGAYAFYNNASLVKIKLPSTLSVIGNYAFGNCQQLMKMNVAAYAPPTVSSNTFYSVPRTATVYVPESAINTYKSTYIWNEFFIESNVQDALDNIFTDSEEQVQKLLIHGQVFIIRNGKCYDLMGQEVETEM